MRRRTKAAPTDAWQAIAILAGAGVLIGLSGGGLLSFLGVAALAGYVFYQTRKNQ